MKRPVKEAALREKLIGLGEESTRKTYYPELKKKIRDLEIAKEKVEKAYKSQNDFFHSMYHELKTPAHGIATLSKLLLNVVESTENKQMVQDIHTSAMRLNLLIGELFDATKEGLDQLDDIKRVDLNKLVENSISPIISRVSATTGQEVELYADWNIAYKFLGRIKQIELGIENFLKIITKYSDRDKRCIFQITKGKEDATHFEMIFEIELINEFINPERQKRFYSSIKKAYESATQQSSPPMVNDNVLEAFQGIFSLKETEVGTHFTYSVSLEKSLDDTFPKSRVAGPSEREDGDGVPKVLIAEDNEINVRVTELMLEDKECEIIIARNGKEAVDLSEVYNFNLILMDIKMPVMDGKEAIIEIRRRERLEGSHTPIIALTAYAMSGDKEKVINAGADEYLTKPVDIERFDEMFEKFLPKKDVA